MPKEVIASLGEGKYQSADVVGRSVTLLMVDKKRHGELVYSECGNFRELENGEKGYHAVTKKMLDVDADQELAELAVFQRILKESERKEEHVN